MVDNNFVVTVYLVAYFAEAMKRTAALWRLALKAPITATPELPAQCVPLTWLVACRIPLLPDNGLNSLYIPFTFAACRTFYGPPPASIKDLCPLQAPVVYRCLRTLRTRHAASTILNRIKAASAMSGREMTAEKLILPTVCCISIIWLKDAWSSFGNSVADGNGVWTSF